MASEVKILLMRAWASKQLFDSGIQAQKVPNELSRETLTDKHKRKESARESSFWPKSFLTQTRTCRHRQCVARSSVVIFSRTGNDVEYATKFLVIGSWLLCVFVLVRGSDRRGRGGWGRSQCKVKLVFCLHILVHTKTVKRGKCAARVSVTSQIAWSYLLSDYYR